MTLTTAPNTPNLLRPDAAFLLTAHWPAPPDSLRIAASVHPGAYTHEYAIGGRLAEQVALVEHAELPIALVLRQREDGWAFDYLGGPEWFDAHSAHSPPVPRSAQELGEAEQAMLRQSLGIPDGAPLPEPQGPLPPAEQPSEPYRFDPTPHMDLQTADPAPELPPPAPPGPDPDPGAQTSPVPRIPPPKKKGLGAYGDQSVPFAH